MRLWHCKYSFYLPLLVFYLTVPSAHTVAVRSHFADAKKILTSSKFLDVGEFFESLGEAIFPSSDSIDCQGDNSENALHNLRVRKALSVAAARQSASDGNVVILPSSPRKNRHIFSSAQTPQKYSRQLGNNKKQPSIGARPVTVLEAKPREAGSDLENTSKDDDSINSDSQTPMRTSTSAPSPYPYPVPEGDVYLNATMDPGIPKDSISIVSEPKREDWPSESTFAVELGVFNPSSEELLNVTSTDSASPEIDDDDSSNSDIQSDADTLTPQPSASPGPQEQGEQILVPPDTEFGDVTQDPAELEEQGSIESANPVTISALAATETTEATPESAIPEPKVDSDKSPAKRKGKPSSEVTGVSEAAEASFEPSVLVDVPLSVSSSERLITPEFDNHARHFLGKTTTTSADQWKPTEVSSTVRTSQRQGSRWEVTYQGELSKPTAREKVNKLERGINEGAMDTYLGERLSTAVTVRTAAAPSVDAPPRNEIEVTGSVPKESFAGKASTNTEEGGNDSIRVILGTCFGLLGALITAAAAFVLVRRQRRNDGEHVLDGVATEPTTMTSFETDRSESRFQTGPTKPRGPLVLRNQSRILDWQMDHATAT